MNNLKKKLKKFAISLARGMGSQIAFLIKREAGKHAGKAVGKMSKWLASKFPRLAKTSSKASVI